MLFEMHAHVICDVDDGARSEEEMYRMLQCAAEGGVTQLICTSHFRADVPFPAQVYRQNLALARDWCRENAPQLTLYPGAEILYSPEIPEMLRAGRVPTLADTRMILVEFRPGTGASEMSGALYGLMEDGWQVVLAHAERYRALHSLRRIREMRACGVLMQMNSETVYDEQMGFFFRRRVERMLREGMIDFISSDAHNMDSRIFSLRYARHWLARHMGQETADRLCGDAFAARMENREGRTKEPDGEKSQGT